MMAGVADFGTNSSDGYVSHTWERTHQVRYALVHSWQSVIVNCVPVCEEVMQMRVKSRIRIKLTKNVPLKEHSLKVLVFANDSLRLLF